MESLVYSDDRDLIFKTTVIGHFNIGYGSDTSDGNVDIVRDLRAMKEENSISFKIFKRSDLYDSFMYDQIFYLLTAKLGLVYQTVSLYLFDYCDDKEILLLILEFFKSFKRNRIELLEDRTHFCIKVDNETVFFSAV